MLVFWNLTLRCYFSLGSGFSKFPYTQIKLCSCHSVIPHRIAVALWRACPTFGERMAFSSPAGICWDELYSVAAVRIGKTKWFSVLQRKELKNLSSSSWVIMRMSTVARGTCYSTLLCVMNGWDQKCFWRTDQVSSCCLLSLILLCPPSRNGQME